MSGEDISLHWGAVLPAVVSLLIILVSPVFAAQGLVDIGIGDVYTDDGYVVNSNPEDSEYYFPTDRDLELEDPDTFNTIFSERKIYMPYNIYNL